MKVNLTNSLLKKSLLLFTAAVLMFSFNSCSKYDDGPAFSLRTKTARLTGEWELVKEDGKKPSEDFKVLIEIEKDGKIELKIVEGANALSYEGSWKWIDGKESLEVLIDGDKEEWEIKRLTNKEFWFETEDGTDMECEKK